MLWHLPSYVVLLKLFFFVLCFILPRLAIPPKCSPDPNRLSLASSINTSRCFFFKHSINYTTPYFLYSFFETTVVAVTAPPSSVYCGYVNSGRQGWMSWDSLVFVSPCHTLLSHSGSPISLSFSHSRSLILPFCSICVECKSSLSLTPITPMAGVASFPVHRRHDCGGEDLDFWFKNFISDSLLFGFPQANPQKQRRRRSMRGWMQIGFQICDQGFFACFGIQHKPRVLLRRQDVLIT